MKSSHEVILPDFSTFHNSFFFDFLISLQSTLILFATLRNSDLISLKTKPTTAKNSIKIGNFPEAVQLYTKAIELLPDNSILYANRSMCHLTMGSPDAVNDATVSVKLDPTYAKAYYRLGAAQYSIGAFQEAKSALESGLQLVPGNYTQGA